MQRPPRFLLAGGGTGGHVYPAIAIADALRSLVPKAAFAFAGTQDKLEWTAVPDAGYAIHPITVQGFHRKQVLRNVAFPFKLAKGLADSLNLVGAFDPDVAIGTGGFVAGPVLLAARLRGRPIVLQEQNAFPGVTNKLLGRIASQAHIAFPEAGQFFRKEIVIQSGNPTRAALRSVDPAAARTYFKIKDGQQVLLMFGGSLGSAALNEALARDLEQLLQDEHLVVLWQTGRLYYDRYRASISKHPRLRLMKYIDRMDYALEVADLALVRAGAITCSELLITGTPSVLVPSPNVAEDHQTKNAKSMHEQGASVFITDEQLEQELVPRVRLLMADKNQLRQMSVAAKTAARPNAAMEIARHILQLIARESS